MYEARTRKHRNRITELRGISWEMADKVEDGSLDFVFIDADHEYESVIRDIKAWAPKVKPGGLVSGHDTHFPGVLKAINELIPNWKPANVDHVWFCDKEDVLI
jgi:predicted O-methyltransferase YrrM